MIGSPVMIRPAQTADLDPMVTLAQACFGSSAWGPAHFQAREDLLAARWVLVADLPVQRCAGYLVMEMAVQEAELQSLAVQKQLRSQGVGTALLAAGLETALRRGAERVFLEVRAGNAAAQRFYNRHGFAEYGRRSHYYRDPDEAAVLMHWPAASRAKP